MTIAPPPDFSSRFRVDHLAVQIGVVFHPAAQTGRLCERKDVLADFRAAEVATEPSDVVPHGLTESRVSRIGRRRGVVLAAVVVGGVHVPPVLTPVFAFAVFFHD